MTRIVVTGATSFIGVHLIQALQKESVEVYAVIRPNSRNQKRLDDFSGLHIISCELKDMDKLENLLPENIDLFYHLAWEGARKPYRDDEKIQQLNYQAAVQAYQVVKEKNCRKFIGVGSQAEYGTSQGIITEGYPAYPNTQYGKYKLKTYRELEKKGKNDGIAVIWPRIFSVYGKYDYPGTLIMSAMEKMKRDQPIDLTQCVQNWNYIYVKDIGRMLCQMGFEDCEIGIYNFASKDNRPLREYVEELKQILGSHSKLNFGSVRYGAEGIVSFQPSIEKFTQNCPFFTFTDFKNGICEMLEQQCEEKDW